MTKYLQQYICSFIVLFAFFLSPARAQSPLKLEPLGQVVIPHGYSYKGTPVGGLSGLSYDPKTGNFYVISDDKSEFADARFYTVSLCWADDGPLKLDGVQFENVEFLKRKGSTAYPEGEIDAEGIAVGPDSLMYISSEGDTGIGVAPFINAYSRNGALVKRLPVPKAYWTAQRKNHGIRENFGFEGLTISRDGTRLYAGLENALHQDGPAAAPSAASPARIIIYDLPAGEVAHEFLYRVSPVYLSGGKRGELAVNGLTDMVALEEKGRLLTIDRNYVAGQGTRISLYEVQAFTGTDIRGVSSMQAYESTMKPVHKELVAHLGEYGITLDNFEGLALGPALPGGGRLLLMVSDNNFSKVQQTLFTAFRLHSGTELKMSARSCAPLH